MTQAVCWWYLIWGGGCADQYLAPSSSYTLYPVWDMISVLDVSHWNRPLMLKFLPVVLLNHFFLSDVSSNLSHKHFLEYLEVKLKNLFLFGSWRRPQLCVNTELREIYWMCFKGFFSRIFKNLVKHFGFHCGYWTSWWWFHLVGARSSPDKWKYHMLTVLHVLIPQREGFLRWIWKEISCQMPQRVTNIKWFEFLGESDLFSIITS